MKLFITFEGIDGCGKTTQINLLEKFLSCKGEKFITIREPGGTNLSEEIRNILLNSKEFINPITELLLFESARTELTEKVIVPALNNGVIVLCDRFFDSTTAYQGYGRQLDINKIKMLNKLATNGIEPDITFYLSLPLSVAKERTKSKKFDRIESSDENFFKRVIAGFDELCEIEKHRFIKIDATQNIENIHNLILKYLIIRFQI